MGTMTAQILIGTPHQNHGGITPTHCLYLSENSRPAWILVPQNIFIEKEDQNYGKIVWIPTLENMLEDALLMIGLHVVQDEKIKNLAEKCFHNESPEHAALYEDIKKEDLENLYALSRQMGNRFKIIISVFRESSIMPQLKMLEKYRMDVEMCTPTYSRLYSA